MPGFKRHQDVILKTEPNQEYVEYNEEHEGFPITAGMKGRVNLIMPNGQYHVEIFNEKKEIVAYALMYEEELDAD